MRYFLLLMIAALFTQEAEARPSWLVRRNRNPLLHFMSFEENWSRYGSPDVILAKFRQDFPSALNPSYVSVDCLKLTDNNRSLLGDSDPTVGRPSIDAPNSAFVTWYMKCVSQFIKEETRAALSTYVTDSTGMIGTPRTLGKEDFAKLYSMKIVDECLANGEVLESNTAIGSFPCSWNKLSAAAKRSFIGKYILKYIGPEDVIIDAELAESEDALVVSVLTEVEKFAGAPSSKFNFLFAQQPEFVTVDVAARIAKFLIQVQDILKY